MAKPNTLDLRRRRDLPANQLITKRTGLSSFFVDSYDGKKLIPELKRIGIQEYQNIANQANPYCLLSFCFKGTYPEFRINTRHSNDYLMKVDDVNEGYQRILLPFTYDLMEKYYNIWFKTFSHPEIQTIISFKLDTGECYFKTLGDFTLDEFIYQEGPVCCPFDKVNLIASIPPESSGINSGQMMVVRGRLLIFRFADNDALVEALKKDCGNRLPIFQSEDIWWIKFGPVCPRNQEHMNYTIELLTANGLDRIVE